MFKKVMSFVAVAGLVLALAPAAQAGFVGQLGILDEAWFAANPTNPGTTNPWQAGDTYHLAFVTLGTRNGISADIGDYNAFVQAAADAAGIGATESVTWKAIASTATVNAKDNAVVSAPVYNLGPELVATGYADIWNGSLTSAILYTEYGEIPSYSVYPPARFVWTGSNESGEADRPLGVAKPMVGGSNDTNSEWIAVRWAACLDHEGFRLYGLSEPLTVAGGGPGPDPDPDPVGVFSVSQPANDWGAEIQPGTYTHALNFGNSTGSPTINTVPFVASQHGSFPGGNGNISYIQSWNGTDPNNVINDGGLPAGNNLADEFLHSNTSGATLDLTGLTAGQEYLLKLFYVGWDAAGDRTATFLDIDTGAQIVFDSEANGNNQGSVLSYLYTAQPDGQLNLSIAFARHNNAPHTYALTNQEVTAVIPEPATMALLGLAACGLGGYVRRRRKA